MVEDLLTWLGAQDPATLFWLAVVLVVLGYLFSLWAHPWAKCGLCKGKARHVGAVYTYAWRPCRRCGGSGRKYRLGVRMTGIGRPRSA